MLSQLAQASKPDERLFQQPGIKLIKQLLDFGLRIFPTVNINGNFFCIVKQTGYIKVLSYKKLMKQPDYSFLKNYFDWQTFPVNDGNFLSKSAVEYISKRYPEYNDRDYEYASIFYEKNTNVIISCAPSDIPESYNKSFRFYLKQLPSLGLHDVAFFFKLINEEDHFMQGIFQWPANYPSPFCKDFLKDTYGYVAYNYQFMHLVVNSGPC